MDISPYTLLLVVHIAVGTLGTVGGVVAMLTRKGSLWHRRAGRVFAVSMLAIIGLALVMSVMRPNAFLFMVGLFSAYLVAVGWRAAVVRDGRPRRLDWTIAWSMAGAGLVMIGWGVAGMVTGASYPAPVLIVFGLIGGAFALGDLRLFRAGGARGVDRIARHLGHMTGGFIAALTAVLVVNGGALPDLVRWLAPTVLLTPVIVTWRVRLARDARPARATA